MVEEYSYKLPENGKHRKISQEDITKVLRAIESYLNNPISGRNDIKQIVIPFIFSKLGFGIINSEVKQGKFNESIPTEKDEVIRFVIKLITIMESMINKNLDKIEISKKRKESFLQSLLERRNKCYIEIEHVEESDVSKEQPKKEKSNQGSIVTIKGLYAEKEGTKDYYYKQITGGVSPEKLANDICYDEKITKSQKNKRLKLLLVAIKKYYDELLRDIVQGNQTEIAEINNRRASAEEYLEALLQ